MKVALSVFGKTLQQTCFAVTQALGVLGVRSAARAAALTESVRQVDPKISAHALREVCKSFARPELGAKLRVFSGALACAATLAASPTFAQNYDSNGRSENNTVARVAGGVGGAVLGNAIGREANAFWKAALTLGGAYLGQSVGDMATRTPVDQYGRPVTQTGVDENGQPIYTPLADMKNGSMLRPGGRMPTQVTPDVYAQAIRTASDVRAAPAMIGHDGQQWRALDDQTHIALYNMMLEAVALRSVAKLALNEYNSAELAKAVAPGDARRQAEWVAAGQAYQQVFQAYARSYQQVSQALGIAERNGFNVMAQRVMMAVVPADLKNQSVAPTPWPRLDMTIQAKAVEMQALGVGMAGRVTQYGEIVGIAKEQAQSTADASRVALRQR